MRDELRICFTSVVMLLLPLPKQPSSIVKVCRLHGIDRNDTCDDPVKELDFEDV